MKRRIPLLFLLLMVMSYTPQFCFKIHDLALEYEVALAQAPETVELTIQLRDADGRSQAGEPVRLLQQPDSVPVLSDCQTDALGECHWQVTPGLYELQFSTAPDALTALALAEGGLAGHGITVGETAIRYGFVQIAGGVIYFDTAPEANRPVPFIPTWADLHHHADELPQTTPTFTSTEQSASYPLTPITTPEPGEPAGSTAPSWRLLGFLALGLLTGASLHLISRWRRGRTPARAGEGQHA